MSCEPTTLADLMRITPTLHPRALVEASVTSLKTLRLVSKVVRSMTLTATQGCEVHIGEGGDHPSPKQLVRTMRGARARLDWLHVKVTVTTGVSNMRKICSQDLVVW